MKFKPNYIVIPAIVATVAATGSTLTTLGRTKDMWYQMLTLPAWAPSGTVISVAWTTIFILTAIALILVWNYMQQGSLFQHVMYLFVANGVLNVSWSYLFFVRHEILLSVLVAGLLTLSVVGIILLLRKGKRKLKGTRYWASLLLYPYAGWATLATGLTYAIYLLN